MNNPELNQSANAPLYHDDEDSFEVTPESIAESMKEYFAFERSALDNLVELSRDASKNAQFEAFLDDLAYEALADNEEFIANIKKIKNHRGSEEDQIATRTEQRALVNRQKELILQYANISSERAKSEMDIAKEHIKSLIETELTKDPGTKPHEILSVLGMLTADKDGREIFIFPENLFPKSTNEKWLTYLETVRSHLQAENEIDAGLRAPEEIQHYDSSRFFAHNAVSHDVDQLLGLDKLPDSKWDFKDTRGLVAKIRDSKFPTVETGEKFRTERRIMEGVLGEHAIRALRTKLSDLHK